MFRRRAITGVIAGVGLVASIALTAGPAAAAPPKVIWRANPASVVESDHGSVSFVLQARHLRASTFYKITSPGLNVACLGRPVFFPRIADRNGLINQSVHAFGCDPGRYRIALIELTAPKTERWTSIVIKAPQVIPGNKPGIVIAPNKVTESDQGNASFSINGQDLPASTPWLISSPGLANACGYFLAWDPTTFAFDLPFIFGSPVLVADLDGNFNVSVVGFNCDPGTYLVTSDELVPPHDEDVASLTILPPGSAD